MKRMRQLVMVIAMFSPCMLSACATIQPDHQVRSEVGDGALAKPGDTVHLFYGMNQQAREEFPLDAVVPVYRMGKGYYLGKSAVGRVKVSKDLGDHYIEAVVTEGEIKSDDIARQTTSECLIKLPEPEMKAQTRQQVNWGL